MIGCNLRMALDHGPGVSVNDGAGRRLTPQAARNRSKAASQDGDSGDGLSRGSGAATTGATAPSGRGSVPTMCSVNMRNTSA